MSICCSRLFVEPLFKGIKKGDYYEPYKRLGKELKVHIFKDEVKKGKLTDDIFLKYLMCRPGMRLHIYNKEQPFLGELLDIEYYKHLVLNQKEYENLVLQLKSIRMKFEDIKVDSATSHHIHIYFTESRLETYLDPESDLEYVYGSKTFIETVINAKTLLNPLSIKYLNIQSIKDTTKFTESIISLNKFLYWAYKNMSLLEIELLLVNSGTISFSMGVRKSNDFDIFIYLGVSKIYNDINKKTSNAKIYKVELDMVNPTEGNKFVHRYINVILTDVLKLYDGNKKTYEQYYDDIYFNPTQYYYFYGLKFANLALHVYWRMIRGRPAQFAELIAFSRKLDIPIPLPSLPEYKYHTSRYLTKTKKTKLSKDIHDNISEEIQEYYLTKLEMEYYNNEAKKYKKFDPKTKIVPADKNKFMKTIKFYLKQNYNINMSIFDIEKLLSNKGIETVPKLKQFMLKNKNHYI
jgi:hypothetical protein